MLYVMNTTGAEYILYRHTVASELPGVVQRTADKSRDNTMPAVACCTAVSASHFEGRMTYNQSLQLTPFSSLRSSNGAAELNRYAVAGLAVSRRCFMGQGMRVIRLGMLPIPRGFSHRGLGAPHPRSVHGYGGAASPVVSHGGWSAPGCLRLRQKARGLGVSARWVKRWVSPGGQLVAARCLRSHNQSFVRTPGDVAALANRGAGAAQLQR